MIILTPMIPNKTIEESHNDMSFCTIASKSYIIKVLALYNSLLANADFFKLYICCMDDEAFSVLTRLSLTNAVLIRVSSLESISLLNIKATRTQSEYCWTLKPCIIEYVFNTYNVKSIFYCDSDLYFFSNPRDTYNDLLRCSVYLCPQRDLAWVEDLYGRYQAGFIGFSNTEDGNKALLWWKERCIEWCSISPDPTANRWGDQKYLDMIPEYFANVLISKDLGVNAAPWNIIYNNNYKLSIKNNEVYIEGYRLVAFHFACIDIFNPDSYDLWNLGTLNISNFIKLNIYAPYIIEIRGLINVLSGILPFGARWYFSDKDFCSAKTAYTFSYERMDMEKWDEYYCFCSLVSEKYVIKAISLYNSLADRLNNFYLFICCMDSKTEAVFNALSLPNVKIISLKSIETQQLKNAALGRDMQEYCWTLKPFLCQYVLKNWGIRNIVYCDADMYFFSHPKKIWDEWVGYSIYLCKQRSTATVENLHGMFQAGLIGFNTDPISLQALTWWGERCLEWCSKNADFVQNRWGDQKYLDLLPNKFSSIKISENNGIDAAPWNLIFNGLPMHSIQGYGNKPHVDNTEITAYHFGSLSILNENEFELWDKQKLSFSHEVISYIYKPYLSNIRAVIKNLKQKGLDTNKLLEPHLNKEGCYNYYRLSEGEGEGEYYVFLP